MLEDTSCSGSDGANSAALRGEGGPGLAELPGVPPALGSLSCVGGGRCP